jgi:hypothetical protein
VGDGQGGHSYFRVHAYLALAISLCDGRVSRLRQQVFNAGARL